METIYVICIMTYFLGNFLMRFCNSNTCEVHISHFPGLLKDFSYFFNFLIHSLFSFSTLYTEQNWLNYINDILQCCYIKRKVFLFTFQVCQIFKILDLLTVALLEVKMFINKYLPKPRDRWVMSPEPREKWPWTFLQRVYLLPKLSDRSSSRSWNISI